MGSNKTEKKNVENHFWCFCCIFNLLMAYFSELLINAVLNAPNLVFHLLTNRLTLDDSLSSQSTKNFGKKKNYFLPLPTLNLATSLTCLKCYCLVY